MKRAFCPHHTTNELVLKLKTVKIKHHSNSIDSKTSTLPCIYIYTHIHPHILTLGVQRTIDATNVFWCPFSTRSNPHIFPRADTRKRIYSIFTMRMAKKNSPFFQWRRIGKTKYVYGNKHCSVVSNPHYKTARTHTRARTKRTLLR